MPWFLHKGTKSALIGILMENYSSDVKGKQIAISLKTNNSGTTDNSFVKNFTKWTKWDRT